MLKSSASPESRRTSATEKVRDLIATPEKKDVNVHQFFPHIASDYKVDPTLMFYNEDTEEEDSAEDHDHDEQHLERDATLDIPKAILAVSDENSVSAFTSLRPTTRDSEVPPPDHTFGSVLFDRKGDVTLETSMEKSLKLFAVTAYEENKNANNTSSQDEIPVFTTAVNEEVLSAAKDRRAAALQGARELRSPMDDIIDDKVKTMYLQAIDCFKRGAYGEALALFGKVVLLRPDEPAPYAQRAECFLALTDFQSAILNLKKACLLESAGSSNSKRRYNRLAFIYFLQGQCMFDQKMFSEALESFSQAAEMRSDKEGYHTRSIACLAALERHGECLALVNKRLEAEKANADLYIMRSRLHTMFKNISLCYYDVKDALEIDPDHAEARRVMVAMEAEADRCHTTAIRLNLQGRLRDAAEKISSAIEYNPMKPEYHIIRGALNRRQGQYSAAVDDYLLALDKTDHDERSSIYSEAQRQLLLAYNDFAVDCFKKGLYREAVILLDKAIKGEKNEKGLYLNRGDCFFKMNDYQFALADYQQTLEIDPSDDSVRSRISVIYNEFGSHEYRNKNYGEAEARFSLAIAHNPRIAHYYLSRSRARYMMENHGEAREDLVAAILLDQSNEEHLSLSARLFPGKTLVDIISSPAAVAIRENLVQYAGVAPHRLQALTDRGGSNGAGHGTVMASSPCKNKDDKILSHLVLEELAPCLPEKEFDSEITNPKKKVARLVKKALQDRKSLRHTGPRLLPLPELVSESKAIAYSGSSGWRKFRHGVGLHD